MSHETFDIDASHSSIGFTVRHMVFTKVHGNFTKFAGKIELDGSDLGLAKVSATVDVGSLDTRDAKRDGHLKSPEFFDVAAHGAMTFASARIESAGGDRYKVHGDLTIRGVTKAVVLDAEYGGRGKDPWGGERIGIAATTTIDRRDFGLTWNQALETGGLLVGETISIALDVQATKA
jgi:polyisoprenoid-binding protein YceI